MRREGMPRKGLWATAIIFLVVFMVGSTIVAVVQDIVGWGWWWAVPASGIFVVLVLMFRILIHFSAEAADRADRELDALEAAEAAARAGASQDSALDTGSEL